MQEAGKINYALRCEQGETRLLALKVEPYNLLLFGEEACVPELLRFLFDGGYEIKNYLCASELGYALARELASYGRCYEEALAMDFMEARRVTEPSAPEVEPAREDDLDEIFDCAQRFVADCGLLDKPERSRSGRYSIRSGSSGQMEKSSAWRASRRPQEMICGSCSSTHGTNTAEEAMRARWSTAQKTRFWRPGSARR